MIKALVVAVLLVVCEAFVPHMIPLTNTRPSFTRTPMTSSEPHPTTESSSKWGLQSINDVTLLGGCAQNDFAIQVTVGNSTLNCILDTGSTTLAVASDRCTSCRGIHPLYVPSSGMVDQNIAVSSKYGDGSGWTGRALLDYVSVPALPANTPSTGLIFAAIDVELKGFFSASPCPDMNQAITYQGIIGFAYASIAVEGTQGFWTQLQQSNGNTIPNVFTIQMCLTSGRLWMGGYDTNFFTSNLQYTSVIDTSYYVVDLSTMGVGGQATGLTSADFGQTVRHPPCLAAADAPLLLLTQSDVFLVCVWCAVSDCR